MPSTILRPLPATIADAYDRGEADGRDRLPFAPPADDRPGVYDAYREGYEALRFIPGEPSVIGGPLPPTARDLAFAISEDAVVVLGHMIDAGADFDVPAKIEQAEDFSYFAGASALLVPSKLVTTASYQSEAAWLSAILDEMAPAPSGGRFYPVILHRVASGGDPVYVVMFEQDPGDPASVRPLGSIQQKHAKWIDPLVNLPGNGRVTGEVSALRVYVTAVTGGTADKPTRGVNIAIGGAAVAVRDMEADAAAVEAAQEAAYDTGSRAAVEAAME